MLFYINNGIHDNSYDNSVQLTNNLSNLLSFQNRNLLALYAERKIKKIRRFYRTFALFNLKNNFHTLNSKTENHNYLKLTYIYISKTIVCNVLNFY